MRLAKKVGQSPIYQEVGAGTALGSVLKELGVPADLGLVSVVNGRVQPDKLYSPRRRRIVDHPADSRRLEESMTTANIPPCYTAGFSGWTSAPAGRIPPPGTPMFRAGSSAVRSRYQAPL